MWLIHLRIRRTLVMGSVLCRGLDFAMLATIGTPPMVETPLQLFVGGRGSEEGDRECPGAGSSLAACRQGGFGLLAAWSSPTRSGRRWKGLVGRRAGQRTGRERKAAGPAQLPSEVIPFGRWLPGPLGTDSEQAHSIPNPPGHLAPTMTSPPILVGRSASTRQRRLELSAARTARGGGNETQAS